MLHDYTAKEKIEGKNIFLKEGKNNWDEISELRKEEYYQKGKISLCNHFKELFLARDLDDDLKDGDEAEIVCYKCNGSFGKKRITQNDIDEAIIKSGMSLREWHEKEITYQLDYIKVV